MEISAGKFKAQCLKLMDQVKTYHEEIIITKYGKPVAKLVPLEQSTQQSLFGYMADSVTITGDIIAPIEDQWEAND